MPTNRHLRDVIESAIDFAVIVTNVDGIITDWNAGAQTIFGWTRQEMLGSPAERFFTPEDRAAGRIDHEMRTALSEGRANDERWHLREGGERFWASGEMMPLRSDDGEHHGFVKILRDRTDQRDATDRLREREDRYRTVLEAVETAFAIVEVKYDARDQPIDYRFLEVNPAFERQAGVDLRGKWVTEYAPDLEQFWFDTYGHVAKTGEPATFENHAKAFGRWFDVRAIRVGNPDNRQIAIFFTDITARRELQARNQAIQELSDKLQDLTTTSAIAAIASEILGRTLGASLVGYGTVDVERAIINVEQDWSVDGVARLPSTIRSRDYGSHFDNLIRNEPVVIADVALDFRTADFTGNLEEIGARAFINLPIFEQGQLVALMYVGQKESRAWTNDEVILVRDIAERVRAATQRAQQQRELVDSEERLQRAQEAGRVGLFAVDLATEIIKVTPQFCRLYGLPPQSSYPAEMIKSLVVPEDQHLLPAVDKPLDGEAVWEVEYRINRADTGELRWLARSGELERDDQDKPRRFVGAAQDVTDRRASEQRLRDSEARARLYADRVQLALAAGAIIGTWLWDIPTDRFTVDEAFARTFGLDPALGYEGLSLAQVVATVHPDDQAGLAAAIEEAISRGGSYAHQYRVRRADDKYYWIEANGRVEHDADAKPGHFSGVLINVEQRRAVEAERDRANAALRALNETLEQRVAERTAELMQTEERLRQSQKMEAVGQLTGGLAHDFNNLLAGISGSLDLMNLRITQGRYKDVERYMVAAQGAANRAAALTHRLLAFSRRQTLDPKPTDINQLSSGMLDLIRRTVGPNIDVSFIKNEDRWSVLVDASQLENSLLNLCINARDAMPSGGKIIIEAHNREIEGLQAELRELKEGEYLVLSVSDNGSGMPPDVIARAFEPFFTTKPTGEGTGLGLSMIYGFAKQSGGQVRIHSVVGEGTTISIFLPRYFGHSDLAESQTQVDAMPAADPGETVLIVDDESIVRMLVADVLQELGYSVLEAADGAAGLKILQSDTRIDLLITDVGLPGGMNGRQMADAARIRRSDLKVLFITGFAENALVKDGQLDPGMSILTKPFAMNTLASRARELISL